MLPPLAVLVQIIPPTAPNFKRDLRPPANLCCYGEIKAKLKLRS